MSFPALKRLQFYFLFVWVNSLAITHAIDCANDCKNQHTNPNYRPQECAELCKDEVDDDVDEDLNGVEEEIKSLKYMVVALLVLVIILLFLFIAVLTKKSRFCALLTSLWKLQKKEKDIEKDKNAKEKDAIGIANYGGNGNLSERGPQHTNSVRNSYCANYCSPPPFEITKPRVRMPSESTCPDESHGDVIGYDNLALSTSTLNYHSRPSSPSTSSSPSSPSAEITGHSMSPLNTSTTTLRADSVNECLNRCELNRKACQISAAN